MFKKLIKKKYISQKEMVYNKIKLEEINGVKRKK